MQVNKFPILEIITGKNNQHSRAGINGQQIDQIDGWNIGVLIGIGGKQVLLGIDDSDALLSADVMHRGQHISNILGPRPR